MESTGVFTDKDKAAAHLKVLQLRIEFFLLCLNEVITIIFHTSDSTS